MKSPIFLLQGEGRGGGGVHEKQIYRGELPKKGRTWTVSKFKGGLAEKRGGGLFEGRVAQ